ncbi:MAG: ShlB/FhaC/HecB family hemolysin secretion/activation protein [Sulfuricellaceae bacterium]|nr:ShlB/FhaC/HecB family hemolysin secretion/activation protein [Sulfuricellaceae bacterium]
MKLDYPLGGSASQRATRHGLCRQALCLWLGIHACAAFAIEDNERIERGGVERPALPSFQKPDKSPLTFPPLPQAVEQDGKGANLAVKVTKIRLDGYSPRFEADLRKLVAPYEIRELTSEDLQNLRQQLTLYYVNQGYINSGAILPDQKIENGEVLIRIVEGNLSQIDISGNQRLRTSYLTERIALDATAPLNVNALQQRLELLRQSGLISRINAELSPGLEAGTSLLKLAVQEARPYELYVSLSNHRSPSIGAYYPEIYGFHRNVSGRGDSIEARYGFSEGLDDYLLGYDLPLNAHDTTLSVRFTRSNSFVVEAPFTDLEIRSDTTSRSLGISHPLWQDLAGSLKLGLLYEQRDSDTYLLGIPFSFSAGIPDGKASEDVWRFSQEWTQRSQNQASALRSTFSSGKTNTLALPDVFGPNRDFLVWLGQFQWAKRTDNRSQWIFRLDTQLTQDALLPMDKFGLGGANSVRGYRENQLMRDKGYVASLEYRIPLFANESGETPWQFALFSDYGRSWNAVGETLGPDHLSSVGVGVLWNPNTRFSGQLYLAHGFQNVENPSQDPQDSGVHFRFSYKIF